MTIEEKTQEMENAKIFLNFIEMYGFDPKKYRRILEIGNTPGTSMAKILNKYKPFLLSYLVTEASLKEAEIFGMSGDIKNGNIVYPDQEELQEHYLKSKITKSPTHPRLDEFDVIIGRGITKKAFDIVGTPQDKFIGFCIESNDPTYESSLIRIQALLEHLNMYEKKEYELVTNEHTFSSKKLCLIKRKGIN